MNRNRIEKFLLFFLVIIPCSFTIGSNIVEVIPLTNKIVIVHFDDGSVNYPNELSVNRLIVADADIKGKWLFASSDDADFQTEQQPVGIGRKSKGTEFVKDPVWGGTSFDPRQKPWASEHWIFLVFDKAMKPGKNYTLKTGNLAVNGSAWNFNFNEYNSRSEAIHVNTLGYISTAPKYGYIYQWMGSLGNLDLSAYIGKKFSLINSETGQVVKSGIVHKRKQANNPETSQAADTPNKNFLGAEVAECDFSEVTAEGTYRLVVEGIGSSYPFKIGNDAIWGAYYNVARALYHQRSGIRLATPYTTRGYVRPVNQNTKITSDDGTSFAGKLLYSDFAFTEWDEGDGGGASQASIRAAANGKPLDVAGWYHDAGDWDSYASHQRIPMLLMLTWEFAPDRFADNELNIPESGNGIPDLIDEASWLIKFNYRLRKELKAKGYSNGGVGGARICADVFTEIDGNSETSLPSWKEKRRTIVTKADAFMTYMYAGEAAQFACILKSLGKNPKKFQVEMLDNIDFAKMTKDEVNWISEAEEAYEWASAPDNQPTGNKNYASKVGVYRMYAAVNLFRLTGKDDYHKAAKAELAKLQSVPGFAEDERWGAFSYLLSSRFNTDKNLQNALKNVALKMANNDGIFSSENRACRWGGNYSFPMLIGQATTPMVFESIIAACITGDKKYENVVHTTADYFLGTNPLHSTWMTGVGPRPAACGFHLDSRYNNNWVNYPGFIPYGPWSMAYGYTPYTWVIDGVSIQGGHGPWNKDWANFSMYPLMEEWPGHERWNSNIHAPMSSENTIHQNTVYGAITYGFANNRHYDNGTAAVKIGSINLCKTDVVINEKGKQEELVVTLNIENATFPVLKWTSSDSRVAHVDALGIITAIDTGTCQVTCTTLDGSVTAGCTVKCKWTGDGEVTPAHKSEVFLDFEAIKLDWVSGYGAFSWNSDQQFITANPSVDALNPSTKVYKWTRDITGNALWGGYGIVLPEKNTEDWDQISFQVYANSSVNVVRFELLLADVKQGEILLSDLNIPANTWTTVNLSLGEMNMVNKNFDKLQIQIAGGSAVPLMTIYSDNFMFEKDSVTVAFDFCQPNSIAVQVYPNPSSDWVHVSCPTGISAIEVFTASGNRIFANSLTGENFLVLLKPSFQSGFHFIRITDTLGHIYVNKLLMKENN